VHADRVAAGDAGTCIRGRAGAGSKGTAGPAKGRIEEGADHAVFGRGARIDVEVFTRAPSVAGTEPVLRTSDTRSVAGIVRARVGNHVSTQIATQLDAGVGAGDV